MNTTEMTIDQLAAHVETIDDVEELQEVRAAEQDGKDRSGAYDVIDARIAALEPGDYPAYDLGAPNTTYAVGHPDGEVQFITDDTGQFTPTNEREVWALNELGAKPGKE